MEKNENNKTILLPQKPWKTFERFIKSIGENEDPEWDGDDKVFLQNIGFLTDCFGPLAVELTEQGQAYFEEKFIRENLDEARRILNSCLCSYPPAEAITQYLWGIKNATTGNALTVLKATGFWIYGEVAPLTHFLELLNEAKVIRYNRKNKKVMVLENPGSQSPPRSIFIDPSRPYSNILWIKRVLGECEEFIYWIDKHFQKEALEWIWEVADASKMKEIKIISLNLSENLNKKARDDYKRLKKELSLKGVNLTWYVIDSRKIRDIHDRWILGRGYARNVPNVNAILSGQRAELSRSDNFDKILKAFKEYLKIASPVTI